MQLLIWWHHITAQMHRELEGVYRQNSRKAVRRCEYPQYMWDNLPVDAKTNNSVLKI